jgi:hypothetical protein
MRFRAAGGKHHCLFEFCNRQNCGKSRQRLAGSAEVSLAHTRTMPNESEVSEYVRQAGYLRDSLHFLKHKISRGDVG